MESLLKVEGKIEKKKKVHILDQSLLAYILTYV